MSTKSLLELLKTGLMDGVKVTEAWIGNHRRSVFTPGALNVGLNLQFSISDEPEDVFLELLDELEVCAAARGVALTRVEDFHVSLSQTVVLRHHWIQPFVQSLRSALATCTRSGTVFCEIAPLT